MNSYELSRVFFDWCFENPHKVKPNHVALYFFCIEHCNRLGWKEKFGLPTTMAMEALGIKSYNTYKYTLFDLVDFGFIEMIELSKNQYSSNIVALSKFDKALDKALDKAMLKHSTKQSESTVQSIDSIDKPITYNIEQLNLKLQIDILKFFGFDETPKNIQHQRLIMAFVKVKKEADELDYFSTQFYDYAKYILDADKLNYRYSLPVFLGDQKEAFINGKWNIENWKLKLENYKTKNNGTKKQQGSDNRSGYTPNTSNGFGKL